MADADQITNPYEVLGVAVNVDAPALRRAYRDAVKRCHPDHGGDPAEFLAIQDAYEQLSDPTRRRDLDEFLSQPRPAAHGADQSGAARSANPHSNQGFPRRPQNTRRTYRSAATPKQVLEGWLEARCLFECDIRGIGLSQLDERAVGAAQAAERLRASGTYDAAIADILDTWRERVTEIRAEVLNETAPDELGAKLRHGPANKGLFTDKALAVGFAGLASAAAVAAGALFGSGGAIETVGTSPLLVAVAVAIAALWWVPTWAAGWVRLGWGRRARRAVVAAAPTTAALSAALWGQWALWGGTVAAVAVLSGAAGFVADWRLRRSFPPPIWWPQRKIRAFRERAAARSEKRQADRAARQAAKGSKRSKVL